jgi:hypothetical protein
LAAADGFESIQHGPAWRDYAHQMKQLGYTVTFGQNIDVPRFDCARVLGETAKDERATPPSNQHTNAQEQSSRPGQGLPD